MAKHLVRYFVNVFARPEHTASAELRSWIHTVAKSGKPVAHHSDILYWTNDYLHVLRWEPEPGLPYIYTVSIKGKLVYLEGDLANDYYKPGRWEEQIRLAAATLAAPTLPQ